MFSLEHRTRISDAIKGENNPMFGKHLSLRTKEKLSRALQGRQFSLDHRRKIALKLMGPNNPMYGNSLSSAHRKKISDSHKGKLHSISRKRKISNSWKLLWKDPEFAKKMWLAFRRSPNKMELRILSILNSLFLRLFKYVGNGKLFVDGKCPDFVSTDGSMLLIEFNGEHWHRGENTRTRARHFAKYGYRTLFIWSRELKNPEKLKKKILKFVNGG
jgi:very-short-patch-repair endonuclease